MLTFYRALEESVSLRKLGDDDCEILIAVLECPTQCQNRGHNEITPHDSVRRLVVSHF